MRCLPKGLVLNIPLVSGPTPTKFSGTIETSHAATSRVSVRSLNVYDVIFLSILVLTTGDLSPFTVHWNSKWYWRAWLTGGFQLIVSAFHVASAVMSRTFFGAAVLKKLSQLSKGYYWNKVKFKTGTSKCFFDLN